MSIFRIFRRNREKKQHECHVFTTEMVLTPKQAEMMMHGKTKQFEDALNAYLREVMDSGVFITEEELTQRVKELADTYGFPIEGLGFKFPARSVDLHFCQGCGAPLKDGKCEYCGHEYK